MKNFVIASLSILSLSLAATTSASAEKTLKQSGELIATTSNNTDITPFELVARAYQGHYRQEGIPGFASFLSGYTTNNITAPDLVRAAIALKELSPETLTDRAYLNNIDFQLLDTAE